MSTPTVELEATQETFELLTQMHVALHLAGAADDSPEQRFCERLIAMVSCSLALQRYHLSRSVAA